IDREPRSEPIASGTSAKRRPLRARHNLLERHADQPYERDRSVAGRAAIQRYFGAQVDLEDGIQPRDGRHEVKYRRRDISMGAGVLIVVEIQMWSDPAQFLPGTADTRESIEIVDRILNFSIGTDKIVGCAGHLRLPGGIAFHCRGPKGSQPLG